MGQELVIQTVARIVLVPTLLVAAAVLIKGYAGAGDGFSAGVIAGLGVLAQYVAFGVPEAERRLPALRLVPLGVPAGLVIVLGVAFVPALAGEPILTHFPRPGVEPIHLGTLELITALLFDAGIFLVVLGAVTGVVARLGREPAEEA